MTDAKIYFIIGCARSGTTSLARILDTAINGQCLMEPAPNLNVETRDLMEGRIHDPRRVIVEQVMPRIAPVLDQGNIYGEKNITLGAFIPYLYEMLKCKFVFLKRDGRDVVTSLMNWHNEVFGSIYRECKDPGPLSDVAKAAVANLPIEKDTSDYSRPRPGSSDPFYDEWPSFSRFEMVTWYWSYINQLFLRNLAEIPNKDWITVNYSGVQVEDIEQVFDFLGLAGFDETQIGTMLEARINSVQERVKIDPRFPKWPAWDMAFQQRFYRIAGETMAQLGYSV